MEKKRSKGVTIFAWSFIILSIFPFFGIKSVFKNYSFLSKFVLLTSTFYTIGYHTVAILAGVNMLKLKAWSRKLTIILAVLGIVSTVVRVPLNHKWLNMYFVDSRFIEMTKKKYDDMSEELKTRMNLSKEEFIEEESKFGLIYGRAFYDVIAVSTAIYLALMLFFFTRPKVKEQFRKGDPNT